jgi:hypothetical protein
MPYSQSHKLNVRLKGFLAEKHFTFQKIFTFKNLMLLAVLFYLIPPFRYAKPTMGIDPSWIIALNYAFHENFIFGKDFIFTYGPLGTLIYPIPIYTSKFLVVLFYLFFVTNAVYFLYYLFKSIEKKSELVLVSATLFLFGDFISRDPVCLYFFFTFHVFHFLKHKNLFSLIIASVCSILLFYAKANVGLIVPVLFLFLIIYNFIFKNLDRITNGIFLVGHFTILYLLSFLLNTDFISYIGSSFPVINSYQDAMTLAPRASELLAAEFIFLMVFIVIFRSFKSILRSYHDLFLLFNLLLLGFILFKNGFVRGDIHEIHFFGGAPFIIMLAYLFIEIKKLRTALFTCIVLTTIISVAYCRWFDNFRLNNLHNIKYNLKTYISSSSDNTLIFKNKTYKRLPERVIKEIGNKTVDVLGSEISYIYYNNLRYNPRPIIQSFEAYDEKLININYNKYTSSSAPDFVLYHFGSIDDRHGFWDEPKIYLALLGNYTIIDTVHGSNNLDSLILFKKNPTSKIISEKAVMDTVIHFNSRFKIPSSDKILYLKLDYNYTFSGKVKKLIYQPSLAYMNLMYENTGSTYCRLVLPVMRSGVPINKKISNFNEAYAFFTSEGKNNENSTYFQLTGNPRWINDSFRVRIIEYEVLEK